MSVTSIKTKAEQAIASQFASVAPLLPGSGWVPAVREAAMARFRTQGLPHRKVEAWKYTDLRGQLKDAFKPALLEKSGLATAALDAALGSSLAGLRCIRVVLLDGSLIRVSAPAGYESGNGYILGSLGKLLDADDAGWVRPLLERHERADQDRIADLNAAFVTDGAVLRIEPGIALGLPIHLVLATRAGEAQAVSTRNLIEIGAGASATILETHVSLGDGAARQVNAVTQVRVQDGARLRHIKVLAEGEVALHLGSWQVDVGAEARYHGFQLSESPHLARNQLFLTFEGEGSEAQFNAAFLGRGQSHLDTTLVIDHTVPRCTSRELVKGVLDGEARGVFQGKVIVREGAQKSDGKQMAKALLLSPSAEFDSKPELEILADDVVCGHGSTVAEIDEEQMFYLRARGIKEAQARALLIEAFIGEALDTVEDEAIAAALRERAIAWLNAGSTS